MDLLVITLSVYFVAFAAAHVWRTKRTAGR